MRNARLRVSLGFESAWMALGLLGVAFAATNAVLSDTLLSKSATRSNWRSESTIVDAIVATLWLTSSVNSG